MAMSCAERSRHIAQFVFQPAADFKSHYLADAVEILAKSHSVFLNIDIAQFEHILAYQRRCLVKIDYIHSGKKLLLVL